VIARLAGEGGEKVSIVLFEARPAEVAALPPDVRGRVRVETGYLHETLERHSDCALAIVEVNSRVEAPQIERLPALRCIFSRSTGLDHIDLEACAARGIEVANIPDYCSAAVAEFAVALLLYLARGSQFFAGSGAGLGTELAGRTAGVLGGGRIGRRVAGALQALGCRVLVYNRRPVEGFEQAGLQRILAEATILSLHLPGEAGLVLGRAAFEDVRAGLLLVNTARASLIDTEALLDALTQGRVAGAALDVGPWETDPRWLDRPDVQALRRRGVLVVTNHVAWGTRDAFARYIAKVAEVVRAWPA
jgi:D-lactate dehydrogenase